MQNNPWVKDRSIIVWTSDVGANYPDLVEDVSQVCRVLGFGPDIVLQGDEPGADDYIGDVLLLKYPFGKPRLVLEAARKKLGNRPRGVRHERKADNDTARSLRDSLCKVLRLSTEEFHHLILDRTDEYGPPLLDTAVGGLIKTVYGGDLALFALLMLADAALLGHVEPSRNLDMDRACNEMLSRFRQETRGADGDSPTVAAYRKGNDGSEDVEGGRAKRLWQIIYGDGTQFDAYYRTFYRIQPFRVLERVINYEQREIALFTLPGHNTHWDEVDVKGLYYTLILDYGVSAHLGFGNLADPQLQVTPEQIQTVGLSITKEWLDQAAKRCNVVSGRTLGSLNNIAGASNEYAELKWRQLKAETSTVSVQLRQLEGLEDHHSVLPQ